MGKNRAPAEAAIDRFIEEMDKYSKERGGNGFSMAKRARRDLIHAARRDNRSVADFLEHVMRPKIQEALEDVAKNGSLLPEKMPDIPPTVH